MKWASNKSTIPHVFPGSWFCKSKQKGGKSEKHLEFSTPKSKQGGSFRSMDDHPYHGRRKQECTSFNDMISDINRGKQRDLNNQSSRKSWGFDDEEEEKISNLQEIKIKTESKKKSVKSYSPRTECKIRALEEKKKRKKSRSKTKKKEAVFDSFAIVKSSYNPEEDFRESMMEMIKEGGIESAQDLQQLLASYLTLNCDEHHDLIIKVFRQVWLELKQEYIHHRVYRF